MSGLSTTQVPLQVTTSNDSTGNGTDPCPSYIEMNDYFLYNLIPAGLIIIAFAFMEKRKSVCLGCLDGRPGVLSPIDFLQGRSRRFSFAAAYGLTAGVLLSIIFSRDDLPVTPQGPSFVAAFYYILAVIIYGGNFYPLFVMLRVDTIVGYVVGTLYMWAYAGITIASVIKPCWSHFEEEGIDVVLEIVGELVYQIPPFLCIIYLVFSFPIRLYISIRDRKMAKTDDHWQEHFQARYVIRMFEPQEEPTPPPKTFGGKIKILIKDLLYSNVSGYRYSTRVICVFVVTLMVVYMLASLIIILTASTVDYLYLLVDAVAENEFVLDLYTDIVSLIVDNPLDFEQSLNVLAAYITAVKVCIYTSVILAFLLLVYNMLRSLACYREDQLLLYKGINKNIPPRRELSNVGMMNGFIRFAGFQVAYAGWAFLILCLVIFVVIFGASAVLFVPLSFGYGKWFINLLYNLWPAPVIAIVLTVIQMLLSRFAFLQEKGAMLAANNRRWLFVFTFFMFFYNVFVGLFSALKRIIFSVVFGAVFMSRMDISSLSRSFEKMDPGFNAYIGLLYVEHVHNHPVLVTFCNILIDDHNRKHQLGRYAPGVQRDEEEAESDHVKRRMFGTPEARRSFKRAQMRWQLVLTMLRAPILQFERKQAIILQKIEDEKVAKKAELLNGDQSKDIHHHNKLFLFDNGSLATTTTTRL